MNKVLPRVSDDEPLVSLQVPSSKQEIYSPYEEPSSMAKAQWRDVT